MTNVYQCENNTYPHIERVDLAFDNGTPFPCTGWNMDDSKCNRLMRRVDLRCTHGCDPVFATIEDIEQHYSDKHLRDAIRD